MIEMPIMSTWSQNSAGVGEKENWMPLKMLEKGEYKENMIN